MYPSVVLLVADDRLASMEAGRIDRGEQRGLQACTMNGHGWRTKLVQPRRVQYQPRRVLARPASQLVARTSHLGVETKSPQSKHCGGLHHDPCTGHACWALARDLNFHAPLAAAHSPTQVHQFLPQLPTPFRGSPW